MKKRSIQSQILFISTILVLITTFGLSWRYYTLIRQDKRREFQQRIQIAFDIIWDDYEARLTSLTNRLQEFVTEDTLSTTTARYLEDTERLQSISFVTTNLVKAAEELKRFGHVNSTQHLMLYGADKRLLAAYHSQNGEELTGIYAQLSGGIDTLIPVDDANLVTSMLLGRADIPAAPLLQEIPAIYEAKIPDAVTSVLFSKDAQVGIRVLAPVIFEDQITGVLLADMFYTQDIVERYAALTQTAVNVFTGTRFSIGTFREHPILETPNSVLCSALRQRAILLEIFPVTINDREYYQGSCMALSAGEQSAVTFTVHLDKESENAAIQKFFTAALYAIALILSMTLGLSWFFSRKISRPIRMIAQQIHRISDGDLRGIDLSQVTPEFKALDQTVPAASRAGIFASAQFVDEDEISVLTHSFHAMAEYLQGMAEVAQRISQGDIAQSIAPRSDHDTLGVAFQHMLAYIRDITDLARDLADGNLLVDAQPRSDQDILNHSLRKMLIYIQGVANVAESIADGNLQVQVEPKSELDVLNQALRRMVAYIQSVADITERIAANDMQVMVSPKSEQDVLNISLYRMVLNLQTARERAEQSMAAVEQQNWLKSGQAELNDAMRGEQNIGMLAKHIMTYLAEYLDAQVGLLYVTEERDGKAVLQLAGSYAYTIRKGHRNEFRFGEGLVGQAALEQESLLFSDIPDGYIMITSGIGDITPQSILVTPFVYEGEVKGVIELGTVYAFTELQREFLALACENIAIAVHTAQARVRMQHLLAETQHQSKALQIQQQELQQSNTELEARTQALQQSEAKLQAQQEELRQSNAQLQAQAEALKVSEEKLQAQQEELRQTNEELEANARQLERQQQILKQKNLELEQSREMLQDKARELELTNRYKSEFLANMSHELRTPLNSVLILSKLLHDNKENNLTDKQKKSAQMIHQSVINWIELIDDILDLSELETGKMTTHYENVHSKTVGTFLEQHFRKTCQDKGLAFHLEIDDTLPDTICTDWKRLEQILKNLVSNAVKFTTQGEVRISLGRPAAGTIFTKAGLHVEHAIAMTVADTGSGISADQLSVIFQAFHQADGSTTRQHGGTGLGLSISQKLAALLGGEIQARSEPGQGSVFTVYLPERPFDEPLDNQQSSHDAALPEIDAGATSIHKTGEILLVDGDEQNRQAIVNLLHHEHLRITAVSSGQHAYQMLQSKAFDVLILDPARLDVSASEFLELLKHDYHLEQMAIVIYTDQELSRAEDTALRAYTDHVILKEGKISEERLIDVAAALLFDPQDEAHSAPAVPAPDDNGYNAVLHGKTILVVDDDVRNLYALANALEDYDLTILMAVNGKGALEQLAEHAEIALVVMDIMMPEMDGYEAMQEIRKHDEFRELPIIALTAKAMKHEQDKCRAAGANDYLTKPVDVENLVSLLQVWLSREMGKSEK